MGWWGSEWCAAWLLTSTECRGRGKSSALTSLVRRYGAALGLPARWQGLRQIEWLPPSRTNTQPWCWRWLMRRRRLATLHRYQQFFAVALGLRVGLIIFPSHIQEHWNHVR